LRGGAHAVILHLADRPTLNGEAPEKLHTDKGYDYKQRRAHLKRKGIKNHIARRSIERNDRLDRHRWVVEGTHA